MGGSLLLSIGIVEKCEDINDSLHSKLFLLGKDDFMRFYYTKRFISLARILRFCFIYMLKAFENNSIRACCINQWRNLHT